MTYEVYRYIFIGGAVLAGVLLLVTVLLFFVLKIPTVIGDLTGATARKAIANIRNQNEVSGEKTYRSSQVNSERGKLTEKISMSGNLMGHRNGIVAGAMATEKISTQKLDVYQPADETSVLSAGGNETTVLGMGGNETTVLNMGGNETTVLNAMDNVMGGGMAYGETSVLEPAQMAVFEIEYEITYIHTDEIIYSI